MALAIAIRNRLVALAPALSRLIKLPEKLRTPNAERPTSNYDIPRQQILILLMHWTLSVWTFGSRPLSAHSLTNSA
ncbi:MAG: hypothetical protein DMF42_02845 [Verrucomicrobia bacterium]|nr:MAG: hypothetical protein DMF42_02845 [Verrucomicrobiota bacterium]